MGLFCGKVCKCKKRCKGAFPTNKALRKGCEAVCKTDSNLDVTNYVCGGYGVSEQEIMLTFGYDPCKDGIGLADVLDPLDSAGQAQAQQEEMKPIIFAGIGLVLVALIVLLFLVWK